MRYLSILLALGMLWPSRARAKARGEGAPCEPPSPELKGTRRGAGRAVPSSSMRSPCGRHVLDVAAGEIRLNGRPVSTAHLLSSPAWRADGDAVAWLERGAGETRLVVLPAISTYSPPLAWQVPQALARDVVSWAGPDRVTVGPDVLAPRAVATFGE